ncbi:MAG: sodium-dependent transporter [Alphaproteobacteria bacterium]
MTSPREQWASNTGFILATIGSAVGIGNIWRFSYVAGENGGGAFLIIYLICVLIVGVPIVISEMAMGRRGGGDAIAAFSGNGRTPRWAHAGWVSVVGCFLILGFYSVIAGWALKYFIGSLTGNLWRIASGGYGSFFGDFIANGAEPVIWQFAAIAATMLVVMGGVRRGIETANRVLMPLLALVVIVLAIYASTLTGSSGGWEFLFVPDWSAFSQPRVYIAALGQAFFSLGIGMAIFITYASYMSPGMRIPRAASAIIAGDTLFAIIAGLAIFPAVFAFGGDPQAGPQLAFITLPQIFLKMPGGTLIGALFFGLLIAAAVTSMVSLLEVPVAAVIHRSRRGRFAAVMLVGLGAFAAGTPSALSYGLLDHVRIGGLGILDLVDKLASNYLLPLGGVLVCLYIGWFWRRADAVEAADLTASPIAGLWIWLVRLVAPALVLLVVLDSSGAI